jgi:hypothetical protein
VSKKAQAQRGGHALHLHPFFSAQGTADAQWAEGCWDGAAGCEMSLSVGSVFEWGTLGRPLTYLVLEAAAFFVLTLCIDARVRGGRAALLPVPARRIWVRWAESLAPVSTIMQT